MNSESRLSCYNNSALRIQVQQVQQAVASGAVAPAKLANLAAADEAPSSAPVGGPSVSGDASHDPSADYPSLPAAEDASAEAGPSHAGRIAAGAAVTLVVHEGCIRMSIPCMWCMLHSADCCLQFVGVCLLSSFTCAAQWRINLYRR